mmetsp:Transcript_13062/g.32800  ORF Transcript_13062/g.32800 Transcript_13062/m.32800 type:complete len:200 (-) Transcript_13062:105-704(-)
MLTACHCHCHCNPMHCIALRFFLLLTGRALLWIWKPWRRRRSSPAAIRRVYTPPARHLRLKRMHAGLQISRAGRSSARMPRTATASSAMATASGGRPTAWRGRARSPPPGRCVGNGSRGRAPSGSARTTSTTPSSAPSTTQRASRPPSTSGRPKTTSFASHPSHPCRNGQLPMANAPMANGPSLGNALANGPLAARSVK